ncbi:MAG TPA: hypothetical protein VL588_07985 [Bdellovibrionota bacterium]|jgi:hypothetical protein|nr:hypothetical protein [Bdellovibrionota bacterium]
MRAIYGFALSSLVLVALPAWADGEAQPVDQHTSDISVGAGGTGGWSDGAAYGGLSVTFTGMFGSDQRPFLNILYGMEHIHLDSTSLGIGGGAEGHWGFRLLNLNHDHGPHFHLGVEPDLSFRLVQDQGPGTTGNDDRVNIEIMGSAGLEWVGDSCDILVLVRGGGWGGDLYGQHSGGAFGGGTYLNCRNVDFGAEWTRDTGEVRPVDAATIGVGVPLGNVGVLNLVIDARYAHEGEYNPNLGVDIGSIPTYQVETQGWLTFQRAF